MSNRKRNHPMANSARNVREKKEAVIVEVNLFRRNAGRLPPLTEGSRAVKLLI
jgi:hypothetical protein